MSVKQWAKHLWAHIERERVDFLVEWARKNGVENPQHIYETALAEFPMAGEKKARKYAEAALRKLGKNKKVRMQKRPGKY